MAWFTRQCIQALERRLKEQMRRARGRQPFTAIYGVQFQIKVGSVYAFAAEQILKEREAGGSGLPPRSVVK